MGLIVVGADRPDSEPLRVLPTLSKLPTPVLVLADRASVKELLMRLGTREILAWPASEERLMLAISRATAVQYSRPMQMDNAD